MFETVTAASGHSFERLKGVAGVLGAGDQLLLVQHLA